MRIDSQRCPEMDNESIEQCIHPEHHVGPHAAIITLPEIGRRVVVRWAKRA